MKLTNFTSFASNVIFAFCEYEFCEQNIKVLHNENDVRSNNIWIIIYDFLKKREDLVNSSNATNARIDIRTPSYEQIATSTSFSNHTESSSGTTREVPLEESESDEFELLKREFAVV